MTINILSQIVVFTPLIGFLIAGLGYQYIGDRGAQRITCGLMFIAVLAAIALNQKILFTQQSAVIPLFQWLKIGGFEVLVGLKIDSLSVIMIGVVTLVSFLVHVYSIGYMSHDKSIPRFMAYLSLFTFAMLMLITSPNFVQLFFGWEGVGVASYLLIGFWYERSSAGAAAMKAFLVNRVGDIGLALGIATIFAVFNTVDIDQFLLAIKPLDSLNARPLFEFWGAQVDLLTLIGILLFVGAMGKSAQLGLHTWLPDAMEGPTPVSALIHAATMVTAGVFLIARLSFLYEMAPLAREVIVIVGAVTAFFAATVAMTQTDIKRVIAYSTCSQLGYMFFAAGCSGYGAAMFHLVTHAFFKALLFLGAGSVIHALSDEQDMEKMGGIYRLIPKTYAFMWIGSLALAGIPYCAGYYSKDAILETAFLSGSMYSHFAFVLGLFVAFLTAFYSWRLLLLTFHGQAQANEKVMAHIHEAPLSMLIPLAILSVGAVTSGYVMHDWFVGTEADLFWGGAIVVHSHSLDVPYFIKIAPLICALSGIILAYLVYGGKRGVAEVISSLFRPFYVFFKNKWYFDQLYDWLFVKRAWAFGYTFWQQGDKNIIDRYGPDGTSKLSLVAAKWISYLQTGYVYQYALVMIFGLFLLITWCLQNEMGISHAG